MRNQFNILYDLFIKYNVATSGEILLVCQINGRSVETLEDILYAKTGYNNIYQLVDEIDENRYVIKEGTDNEYFTENWKNL
tara:strand:- start:876 stop:1118 length:243 start_codon:yes stop_codon:yes gene_type:complete